MGREWKPGDVALVKYMDYPPSVSVRVTQCAMHEGSDDHWHTQRGTTADGFLAEWVRPLVVINPEDEGDVAALVSALHWDTDPSDIPATWRAQDALRALANPQPPKPEEPTGLGAVVEDDEGALWVRISILFRKCSEPNRGRYLPFADIAAVKVLSEGVPS